MGLLLRLRLSNFRFFSIFIVSFVVLGIFENRSMVYASACESAFGAQPGKLQNANIEIRDSSSSHVLFEMRLGSENIWFKKLRFEPQGSLYEESTMKRSEFLHAIAKSFADQLPSFGLKPEAVGPVRYEVHFYGESDPMSQIRLKAGFFAVLIESASFRFILSGTSFDPAGWTHLAWAQPGPYLSPSIGAIPGKVMMSTRSDDGIEIGSKNHLRLLQLLKPFVTDESKIETGSNNPFYTLRATTIVGLETKLMAAVANDPVLSALISSAEMSGQRGGSGRGNSAKLFRFSSGDLP